MEIIGRIKMIGATVQVSASFKKRELVITTDEQYPQMILTEFNQDKCDILDGYKEGESVKVSINLRGREWINPEGVAKYFNQIQGWRIERTTVQGPPSAVDNYQANQAPAQSHAAVPIPPASAFKEEDHDDLPFN